MMFNEACTSICDLCYNIQYNSDLSIVSNLWLANVISPLPLMMSTATSSIVGKRIEEKVILHKIEG